MSIILYLTILIYFCPFQQLCYLWPYCLLSYIFLIYRFRIKLDFCSKWFLKWIFIGFVLFITSSILNFSNINNFFWSCITYGSFFVLFFALLLIDTSKICFKKVFIWFFLLSFAQVFIGYYQMISAYNFSTFNPFKLDMGAGDFFVGTLFVKWNSAILAVKLFMLLFILLFCLINRIKLSNIILVIFALFGCILPSSMTTVVCGVVSIIVYFLPDIKKNILNLKVKKVYLYLIIFLCTFCILNIIIQKDNVQYAENIIISTSKIVEGQYSVRKLIAYKNGFIDLFCENPLNAIWGVGPGNFSSRASALVSGNYLVNQPEYIHVTPAYYAEKYIIPLWQKSVDGSANQPYASWLSVFSEYGILGVSLFMLFFYKFFKTLNFIIKYDNVFYNNICNGIALFSVFLMIIFFFDNWLEMPQVMGPYAVFAVLLIKHCSFLQKSVEIFNDKKT